MKIENEQVSEFHEELAAAFVRGSLGQATPKDLIQAGYALHLGPKMQKFKQVPTLPRVTAALTPLLALKPASLVDIGGATGSSLVQILLHFPTTDITVIDIDEEAVARTETLFRGLRVARAREGYQAIHMDITKVPWRGMWDGATMLEVLEHLKEPELAVQNAMRVVKRFVVFSVPSEPDTNPRHLHLIPQGELDRMFREAGAARLHFHHAPGHIVGVAEKE